MGVFLTLYASDGLPWVDLHGTTMRMITSPNGTPISSLTFGAMQFGGGADAQQSHAMFQAARDAGLTHFDTAHVYTGGASETLLGQCIQAERDALTIATKAVSYTI